MVNELRREKDEADTETLPSLDEGSVVSGDEETEMPTPQLEVHEPIRFGMHSSCHGCCRARIRVQEKGLCDEDGSSLLEGAIPVRVADSFG